MKKYDDSLFQIGEVSKIIGITRKAILLYEEKGLITPAVKDKESGYRYYTADNITQLRSIRSLQSLGLSLKEISEYYYDATNIDNHLNRLITLRATLDRNIQLLQARSARQGDLSVHKTALPRQVCFCRRYQCKDTAEAAVNLRNTYIAAARTGKMSVFLRMFTIRMNSDPSNLDLLCCIPVDDSFNGTERIEFQETQALCIYYRGSYEGTGKAIRALLVYIQENTIQTSGQFRSIYLEGPPNRGERSEDYITQVAVPINIGGGGKFCAFFFFLTFQGKYIFQQRNNAPEKYPRPIKKRSARHRGAA